MNKINSYKKKITLILSLFIMLSVYTNSFLAEVEINEDDGIYFIDIFDDLDDFELINCTTSKENGKIILDPLSSTTRTYDYSNWNIESDDKAYSYTFLFPLPPKFGINYCENEFDGSVDYNLIKSKNNIFYPLTKVIEPLFKRPWRKIHHFRIKIDEDINFTSKLNIYWCGKAENDLKISLYYWQQAPGSIGMWHEAASGTSDSSVIEIQQNFTGDLFIDEDNFIDFCLVATPLISEECFIFTDYVKINTYGQGSSYYGHFVSNEIDPEYLDRWEYFSWEDFERSGTSIKYHILYQNSTGDFNLVDNTDLPGNENGFTSSPVDIGDLPLYDIKILANLSTDNPSTSPEIDSLSLSWQTNNNVWRDRFSSTLRVDQIHNVIISNGEVKLILSSNDWLMFGKNSANIRSTDSYGPDVNNHSLYWYTTTLCGGEYRNPILNNNVLYIASIDGDKLYSFNATITEEDEGSTVVPLKQVEIPVNTIESSPALTNDGKLIVASGTTSTNGDIDNKIFAFSTDNILSDDPIWEFNYSNNEYICYSASPTIYGDTILISSWSGKDSIWDSLWNNFNFSSGNNKLIALDFDGNLKWIYDLPAGSFSSPAVYDDIVIVGCENNDGSSIFAIDVNNGEKIWDNSIGSIGRNSPLIYDNKIFITVKERGALPFTGFERIVTLDFSDGSEIWNVSIGDYVADNYEKIGVASSSVYDDYLYAVSADGTVYAFDIEDGEEKWSKKIYTKYILSSFYLASSPVCTQDILYIGTPDGIIYALNRLNGSTIWQENSYDNSPIQNSPIIVNGIIYYNSENGMLYSRGEFKPIENEIIKGSIISSPIYKPDPNYKWNKFYADYQTDEGKIEFYILDKNKFILLDDISDESNISKSNVNNKDVIRLRADFSANYSLNESGEAILNDWRVTFGDEDYSTDTIFYDSSFYSSGYPPICKIDVQNKYIGLLDSAEFRVKYEQESDEYTSNWYDAVFSGDDGTLSRATITADLSDIDILDDETIFLEIQFKINDAGEDNNETISTWYEIEYETPDVQPPIFFEDTFTPEEGWISINNPVCSIKVKDEGTKGNISGLNTASGKYYFQYRDSTTFRSYTGIATTTETNGTINTITLTADLSELEFIDDIVEFRKIRFYIEDMAGNNKYSNYIEFETDNEKPYSWLINTDEIPSKTNLSSIRIDAEAEDNLSGIKYVDLYYSKEDSNWKIFNSDSDAPYTWNFSITKTIGGGIFELCTIATDLANNIENYPTNGDISFIYDPIDPWINIPKTEYVFNKTNEVPSFDDIEFIDDYKLKKVEYRLDFYEPNKWIQINDEDLDEKSYIPTWNLSEEDWDYLVEDVKYNLYFRITDSLDNIYETTITKDPVKVIKNLEVDIIHSPYDPDISDLETLNWNNIYKIFVDINENEVSEIKLLYRYSQDDKNWTNWMQYGELLNTSPFEWEFKVDNGSGFYEFKTSGLDPAGSYLESEIQSIELILFPFYQIIALILSVIFLLIVTTLIIKKLKK